MTRTKKLLVLVAALVVVCGAALLAVKLNPDDDEVAEDTGTVILTVDSTDVCGIAWDYEEAVAFSCDGGEWTYDDDSAFPVNASYLDSMVSALESVSAYTTIENAEDLSQYGLDEPVCTITVTTGEGETTLSMGSESALGGERYVTLDGSTVYLVDSEILNSFSYGLYDIVETESIPDMGDIVRFDVSAETQSLCIDRIEDSGIAYSDNYVWFAESDNGYVTLDTGLTGDFTDTIANLSWNDCVDYAADEEALVSYGLDSPAAVVTVTYSETTQVDTNETDEDGNPVTGERTEDRTFVLEIGDYSGSDCYARIAGSSMVYLVDASVSDTMLYTGISGLLPDDVLEMDWTQVNALDITVGSMTYTLTHETLEETDEEGTVSERTVWLCDGQEKDMTSSLNTLTGLASAGSAAGIIPEREAVLSFVIHQDSEAWQEVDVTFYTYDSASCVEVLNGETTLFVSRTDIDSLADVLTVLLSPETEDAAE